VEGLDERRKEESAERQGKVENIPTEFSLRAEQLPR
jgi:hypothetical protein